MGRRTWRRIADLGFETEDEAMDRVLKHLESIGEFFVRENRMLGKQHIDQAIQLIVELRATHPHQES